ncbi:MAG: site-specific integrase [Actinomycetota bacterium]|nr:site-specific integrase [Actinomycetota bacterium]
MGVVCEDLGPPAWHGARQPGDLVDLDAIPPVEERFEVGDCGDGIVGVVDLAQQPAGVPGALDFEVRIADVEGLADALVGAVVEPSTATSSSFRTSCWTRRRTSSTTWLPRPDRVEVVNHDRALVRLRPGPPPRPDAARPGHGARLGCVDGGNRVADRAGPRRHRPPVRMLEVDDVSPAMPLPRKSRNLRSRALHPQQGRRLAQAADRAGIAGLAVLVGLYTGARRGEIASLAWSNIDCANDVITLVRPKTRDRLDLPLAAPLRSRLEQRHVPGDVWVFPGRLGGHVTATQIWHWVRGVAAAAASPHHPHQLRHTYGTDVHDLSENLRTAQVAMGHTSPAVTAQYTRVTDQQMRDAIARLPYLDERGRRRRRGRLTTRKRPHRVRRWERENALYGPEPGRGYGGLRIGVTEAQHFSVTC